MAYIEITGIEVRYQRAGWNSPQDPSKPPKPYHIWIYHTFYSENESSYALKLVLELEIEIGRLRKKVTK